MVKYVVLHNFTPLFHCLYRKARNDNNKNDGYGVIGMEEYFMVLDGVYSSSNALQPSLQNKLKGFYPVLKVGMIIICHR